MYKHWILSLLTAVMIAASTPAHAKQYEVGGCNPTLPQFPTIQVAVLSVPPDRRFWSAQGRILSK